MNKTKIISAVLTALTVVGIASAVIVNFTKPQTPELQPSQTPAVSAPIINNTTPNTEVTPSPSPSPVEDDKLDAVTPPPAPDYSTEPLIDAFKVVVDGQTVGMVTSEDELQEIISGMLSDYKEMENLDNAIYELTQTIELKKTSTFANNISHDKEIENVISEYIVFKVEAYELSADGHVIGYFATEQECTDILTAAKNKYTSRHMAGMNILSVDFERPFSTECKSVLKEELGKVSFSDAVEQIISASPVRKTLQITSAEELENLYNSKNILTDREYAAKVLSEKGSVSVLCDEKIASFVVKVQTSTSTPIPFSTTTKTNGSLSYTTKRVSVKGVDGSLTQYYEDIYVDGEFISSAPTSQKKVNPTNEVVEYGTYLPYGTKVNAKTGIGMFKWPNTGVITSHFSSSHGAIDIAPVWSRDSYDIYAAASGEVVEVGNWPDSSGLFVVIKHNGTYTTKYAHMSKIIVVKGQYVKQGQLIGYVGSTGSATGPHCHFAIIKNGKAINPTTMLYGYAG